jgi:hypothetical protein
MSAQGLKIPYKQPRRGRLPVLKRASKISAWFRICGKVVVLFTQLFWFRMFSLNVVGAGGFYSQGGRAS